MAVAQFDEVTDKFLQLAALFTDIPVYPADLAVLAVGIVAAALGPGELVSRQEHGRTLCKEQRGEQVAHLPIAQVDDLRVLGRPLDTAVPRPVIGVAIAVVFAVGLVVLVVVGNQVVKGKTVMRGDEVDR
ncbi:hypothetical protein D3C73_1349960 [compost metagenome]